MGNSENGISDPPPVAGFDSAGVITSPRFCIGGDHGVQEPKFRLIGDLTNSNFDKTAQTSEPCCPRGIDSPVAITRLRHINGAADLRQLSVDFPNAYRAIALPPASVEASRFCSLDLVDNGP